MVHARHEETHRQLWMHRFAIELYQTRIELYGIDDEQTALALRLVEATKPDCSAVAVPFPCLVPSRPQAV
jgi:hypothetical protein